MLAWSAQAVGVALPAGGLAACSSGGLRTGTAASAGQIPIASPERPVRLPVHAGNQPIPGGRRPEPGPLRIFTWGLYISPDVLDTFSRTHGVEVKTDTFASMDEALATLTAQSSPGRAVPAYDVVTPQTDVLRALVQADALQPLNPDYLTNVSHVWSELRDPFYDTGSQYTVPYVLWTDGIAWRNDIVTARIAAMPDPYDALWTHAVPGRTAVLDTARDALVLPLLRRGSRAVNTADADDVDEARADLAQLVSRDRLRFDEGTANYLPTGEVVIRESWSGTVLYAPAELPRGTSADVLSFCWPPHVDASLPGVIANDTLAVPRRASHPVLAHMFIDHLLDPRTAAANFAFTRYQPPNSGVDPRSLAGDGSIPASLASAVMTPDDLHVGLRLCELTAPARRLWDAAYQQLQAG